MGCCLLEGRYSIGKKIKINEKNKIKIAPMNGIDKEYNQ